MPKRHGQPGHQLGRPERLRQIVVGSRFQSGHDISLLVFARKEQDVLVSFQWHRANPAAQLNTVDPGHDPVQNQKVWCVRLLQQLPRLISIFGENHAIAPAF